jgi:hypothetical protein
MSAGAWCGKADWQERLASAEVRRDFAHVVDRQRANRSAHP